MKISKFFKKLFPCMSKEDTPNQEQHPTIVDKEYLQDKLNTERQKNLEELRLVELQQEQARKAAEEQTRQAEEKTKQAEEARQAEEAKKAEEKARQAEEQVQKAVELGEEVIDGGPGTYPESDLESIEHEHFGKDEMIHCVFLHYAEKYEEFYSTRPTPIHSNFNEKMFKDLCATFTFNTQEELEACLHDYNLMRQQDRQAYRHLSKKRQLKCDLFKFYLFI